MSHTPTTERNRVTADADYRSQDEETLDRVRLLTGEIRARQNDIQQLARERRTAIVSLRNHRITYRENAEAMGVTEQNVYKILRDHIAQQNATGR